MRKLLLLTCMCMCIVQAWSQHRTISGKVTDEKGIPIARVSVTIKGTSTGTVTNDDGVYSLAIAPTVKTLVFTGIGFERQEVAVADKSTLSISMKAADNTLAEVVVIGYGTVKKKETTGNVVSIKGSTIAEKPVQSFESGLAGKAAGVQITVPNGIVNNPPVFRIRGTNSISLSSYPLIVIDGVATFTGDQGGTSAPANALASINPNDIESIDIAKDAAATAIYGSRAANGVVFITTKRGKTGRSKVTYDGWVGWAKPTRLPELLDAFQFTDFKNEALANAKTNNPTITGSFALTNDANGNPINTNWYDYAYRTAFSTSHNVNVSGGSENTTYYLSAGYTSQQGILQKNDFRRINALLNIDSRINKVLSLGGKLSVSNELNKIGGTSGSLSGEAFSTAGSARLALVQAPNVSPYNNDGSYNLGSASSIGSMNNKVNGSGPLTFPNIVPILNLNRSNNEINHIQSNVYLQIKPVSWITLRTTYGIDYLLVDNDIFYTPIHGDGAGTSLGPGGNGTASFSKGKRWVWTNTAQFDRTFWQKHNFSVLIGGEQQRNTSSSYGISRRGLSDSAYTVVQAGYTTNNTSNMTLGENYLLSSFARLSYNFDSKYFLSGNVRQDEYSALGVKKGTFWGASAGWEIAKESFWSTVHLDKVFSSFRIRGSYGKVGNINGISNFPTYSSYSSGLYGGASTLGFSAAGNNNITWETSKKTDIGFSFGILKDRVTGEFAYYKNNIDGLLLQVPQSPSAGLPNSILSNVGSMYNKGIELTLNAMPVSKKDFSWNTSFNISYNKNEVTALAPGLTEIQSSIGGGGTETVSKTLPGYSIGYLWVVRTAGVDPTTGRRIMVNAAGNNVLYEYGTLPSGKYNYQNPDGTKYVDKVGNSLAISQAADAVLYANTQPKYIGGWDNTVRYKGFDLNFLFTYQLGFSIYYGTNAGLRDMRAWNNSTDVLRRWQKAGDITDVPKPVYGDNISNGSGLPMDANVFKGDFVKLRTVQLGYNLPKTVLDKIKMSNARIYVAAQNLAIITKYPGPDPEVSTDGNATQTQGIDRNTLANGRTITIGMNISF